MSLLMSIGLSLAMSAAQKNSETSPATTPKVESFLDKIISKISAAIFKFIGLQSPKVSPQTLSKPNFEKVEEPNFEKVEELAAFFMFKMFDHKYNKQDRQLVLNELKKGSSYNELTRPEKDEVDKIIKLKEERLKLKEKIETENERENERDNESEKARRRTDPLLMELSQPVKLPHPISKNNSFVAPVPSIPVPKESEITQDSGVSARKIAVKKAEVDDARAFDERYPDEFTSWVQTKGNLWQPYQSSYNPSESLSAKIERLTKAASVKVNILVSDLLKADDPLAALEKAKESDEYKKLTRKEIQQIEDLISCHEVRNDMAFWFNRDIRDLTGIADDPVRLKQLETQRRIRNKSSRTSSGSK